MNIEVFGVDDRPIEVFILDFIFSKAEYIAKLRIGGRRN
jgi:hypothetical protein